MPSIVHRLGPATVLGKVRRKGPAGPITPSQRSDGALLLSIAQDDDRHVLLYFEDHDASVRFALEVLEALYPGDEMLKLIKRGALL